MDNILFKNKYRIATARLRGWDYASVGYYFVTICTKWRHPWFGEINEGRIEMSGVGRIVMLSWTQIPQHFPNVQLDEFVVMPDHVHGIVVIDNGQSVETLQCNVSTGRTTTNVRMSKISPKSRSLSTIVRSFKSTCAYAIHKIYSQKDFAWQSRYYDRIIRNDDELNTIRQYIRNNPKHENVNDR